MLRFASAKCVIARTFYLVANHLVADRLVACICHKPPHTSLTTDTNRYALPSSAFVLTCPAVDLPVLSRRLLPLPYHLPDRCAYDCDCAETVVAAIGIS